MPSIRGGILGWNIDIYSTRTDQFDWSVSHAYVINIYICVYMKKIVLERTRDLICLQFVATDFFLKIISPSAGETPVIQCSPCYSAVSALLMNPLPDSSNYSPVLPHTLNDRPRNLYQIVSLTSRFQSVSSFSQAPSAHGSSALPSPCSRGNC